MSMYLSNSDLRPTGSEPGEFIDVPARDRKDAAESRSTEDPRSDDDSASEVPGFRAGAGTDRRRRR